MKQFRAPLAALAMLSIGLGWTCTAHASWTFTDSGVASGLTTTGVVGAASDSNKATTSYAARDAGSLATDAQTSLSISGAFAANATFGNGATWSTSTTLTAGSSSGAQLNFYSGGGLGMASDGQTAPNHAIDNNGNTEAVLLSFGSSVTLTSIGLGYVSGDADISLFRYVGTTAPTSLNGVGTSLSQMAAAGWNLVGNYGDLVQDTTNPYNLVNGATASGTAGSTSVGSSWWLIVAYNSAYGAATSGTVNQGDDYFKIYAVSGVSCTAGGTACGTPTGSTPEPGSLALVGLAGLGAFGLSRRARKAA